MVGRGRQFASNNLTTIGSGFSLMGHDGAWWVAGQAFGFGLQRCFSSVFNHQVPLLDKPQSVIAVRAV